VVPVTGSLVTVTGTVNQHSQELVAPPCLKTVILRSEATKNLLAQT